MYLELKQSKKIKECLLEEQTLLKKKGEYKMIELVLFIRYKSGDLEPIEVEADVYTEESLKGMRERFETIECVLRSLYLGKAIEENVEEIYGHITDITVEDDYDILEQFSFTI